MIGPIHTITVHRQWTKPHDVASADITKEEYDYLLERHKQYGDDTISGEAFIILVSGRLDENAITIKVVENPPPPFAK